MPPQVDAAPSQVDAAPSQVDAAPSQVDVVVPPQIDVVPPQIDVVDLDDGEGDMDGFIVVDEIDEFPFAAPQRLTSWPKCLGAQS